MCKTNDFHIPGQCPTVDTYDFNKHIKELNEEFLMILDLHHYFDELCDVYQLLFNEQIKLKYRNLRNWNQVYKDLCDYEEYIKS